MKIYEKTFIDRCMCHMAGIIATREICEKTWCTGDCVIEEHGIQVTILCKDSREPMGKGIFVKQESIEEYIEDLGEAK